MLRIARVSFCIPLVVWACVGLLGCIPTKAARVAAVALTMEDVAKAASKQTDVALIREGTPSYLMLVDGLLESYPDNRDLLLAACQTYGSFASSLPESQSSRGLALYGKAKQLGFRALANRADFAKAASGSPDEFKATLQKYQKSDVPPLFWTATAWAGWISVSMGSVESFAELPLLESTVKRVIELDETFYYGSPHLLMGVLLAAKPPIMGGDLAKAKVQFDRAFSLGADSLLMSRVYFAEYYARGMKDRTLYEQTLHQVLDRRADEKPELTLANTIAQEKAKRLLTKTEDYFAAQP